MVFISAICYLVVRQALTRMVDKLRVIENTNELIILHIVNSPDGMNVLLRL